MFTERNCRKKNSSSKSCHCQKGDILTLLKPFSSMLFTALVCVCACLCACFGERRPVCVCCWSVTFKCCSSFAAAAVLSECFYLFLYIDFFFFFFYRFYLFLYINFFFFFYRYSLYPARLRTITYLPTMIYRVHGNQLFSHASSEHSLKTGLCSQRTLSLQRETRLQSPIIQTDVVSAHKHTYACLSSTGET